MPRVTKNGALAWAVVLLVFAILLFNWNASGYGFLILFASGVFWAIWGYKHNRDTKLAQGGVAATLPPSVQAQRSPASRPLLAAPTVSATPPTHSKGVDRLFVPPALD